MPKHKTCKAAARRFRVTRNGKILFSKSGRRHLNSVMSNKRRRQIRRKGQLRGGDMPKITRAIVHFPPGTELNPDQTGS